MAIGGGKGFHRHPLIDKAGPIYCSQLGSGTEPYSVVGRTIVFVYRLWGHIYLSEANIRLPEEPKSRADQKKRRVCQKD